MRHYSWVVRALFTLIRPFMKVSWGSTRWDCPSHGPTVLGGNQAPPDPCPGSRRHRGPSAPFTARCRRRPRASRASTSTATAPWSCPRRLPATPAWPGSCGMSLSGSRGSAAAPSTDTALALHGDTMALPRDAPAGVPTAHRCHAGCAAPSTMVPGAAPAVPAPQSAPGCSTAPHPAPSQKEEQPQGSIVPKQSPRWCRCRQHNSFIKGGCRRRCYSQVMSRSRSCFLTLCRKPS